MSRKRADKAGTRRTYRLQHTSPMLKFTPSLAVLSLFVAFPLSAAPPKIDNRPPRPDEWGYRPADGSTSPLNPPSLTFPRPGETPGIQIQ